MSMTSSITSWVRRSCATVGGIQMAQAADRLLHGGVVEQTARDMISTQGQEAGLIGLLPARSAGPR